MAALTAICCILTLRAFVEHLKQAGNNSNFIITAVTLNTILKNNTTWNPPLVAENF